MKALIDTCIIIDVLQSRKPFSTDAEKIFLLAANNQFTGYITAKSTTDIYYLTHRLTHSDKSSREVLSKLFTLFEVIDTAGIDCQRAIPSTVSDYEDAVLIETALRFKVNCIVTRNTKDFINSSVTVYSPEEFINILEKEQNQ